MRRISPLRAIYFLAVFMLTASILSTTVLVTWKMYNWGVQPQGVVTFKPKPTAKSTDAPVPVEAISVPQRAVVLLEKPIEWKTGDRVLNLMAWNVESRGNDPVVIAEQMKDFAGCDVIGLSEVSKRSVPVYQAALGPAYQAMVSQTGRGIHLAIILNADRFEVLEEVEMHGLNDGTHRSPIYVRLKERKTGFVFIFMTNHLARRDDWLRKKQAAGLREWARDSYTPIIAMGDFNFDYSLKKRAGNRSFNEFMKDGVWRWVEPNPMIDTQWSDTRGKDRFPDSMLDFVFVANGAKEFDIDCKVVVRPNDFPDTYTTSDHRAVRAEIRY